MVLDPEQFKRMSKDGGSLKRQVDIDAIWRKLDALEALMKTLQHPLAVSPDIPLSEQTHTVPDDLQMGLYLRTGGDGTVELSEIPASEAATDTTNFNTRLSALDTTVQKALDTLDDTPNRVGDLDDVDLTGLADGDVLEWDVATGKWVPATPATGDVVGPAGAVDDNIATFDGITGKLIQDGGAKIADLQAVSQKDAANGYAGLSATTKLSGSQQTYGTLANTACEGNDARLSDARTPTAHNTSHQSGGADAIKLDDLAAPDDNTDLNASATAHGLLPKLSNVVTEFLNGQGGWTVPAGGTGDVVGPAGAVDDNIATYNGITGKIIQDGGSKISDLQAVSQKDAANGYAGLSAATKLSGSQQTYGTLANTACEGNDARLSDARTPSAHAASHQSGGADAIKLDDLAAPDDNTDLDASTTKHGLLKKLSGTATEFLNGSGSWATPAGSVQDKIEEGNSKVEVIDTGTGYVSIYIDGSERFRLGTSGIYDTSGNLLISFSAAASAVNYLAVSNAATGNVVRVTATGSDATVGLTLQGKGGGAVTLSATASSASGTFESTGFIVSGNQVVGAQQAAIADVATGGGTDQDDVARGAINDILGALRAHGLIDT